MRIMKKKLVLIVVAAALLLAACGPTFPMSDTGGPVPGGACGGDGASPWPIHQGQESYLHATRDGVADTGIYANTDSVSPSGPHLDNGFTTFVQTTGGLDIQSGGTIQGCVGNDQFNTPTGNGDGPSNVGVVAQLVDSCGGCIQAFPKINQGFGNFNRTTGDYSGPGNVGTPASDIDSMVSTWNMPQGTATVNNTVYTLNDLTSGDWEQAYDIWPQNNCGGNGNGGGSDSMLWVATSTLRRNENYGGMSGSRTSSTPIHNVNYNLGGTLGTVNIDWGYFGTETVLALHTNVLSGTVDLKKVLNFLLFIGAWANCTTGPPVSLAELDLGWELARTVGAQAWQQVDYQLAANVHAG